MSIDVEMAAMGYLLSPDGRSYRHVPGLDVIAADTFRAGVRVRWGDPPGGAPACAYLWTCQIVLAPRLYRQYGWYIRLAWAHELGHCVTGRRSEASARVWAQRYGDLLVPVFA